MEALRQHFRPEFLNRVDEIIIFDRLSDEDLKKIVEIQLRRLTKRLENQKITLELTDAAKRIAREGYESSLRRATFEARDPEGNSRPTQPPDSRRKIPRGQTIKVDGKDGAMTFTTA